MQKINFSKIIAISLAVLTFICTFFFFKTLNYNLDLSDESYYLYLSVFPKDIYGSLSSFAHFLNLIFYDLNYNIFAYRIFGVSTLILTSFLLFFTLRILFELDKINITFEDKLSMCCFLIFGSLFYYSSWLLTPSYNWALLILMKIFLISKVFQYKTMNENNYFNKLSFLLDSFIISFFILIKPTTGFIILLINFIMSIYLKKKLHVIIFNNLLVTLCTLFFLILIISFFYESLEMYFTQFSTAMKIESSLTEKRGVISLIFSPLQSIFDSIHILSQKYLHETISILIGLILLIFFKKYSLYIITGIILININSRLCLNFSLILILFYYLLSCRKLFNKTTFYVFLLISLIFAYSFGSANNLFVQSMFASFLYFVIIYLLLVYLDTSVKRFQSMLVIFALCFHVILSLKNAFHTPYGYETKIKEFVKTQVSIRNNESLNISKEQSDFMNFTRKAFKKNNWKQNFYLIDLSGKLPGLLYLLNANAVGNPWFNGFYVGSDNYTKNILSLYDIELIKSSWLVTTESGANNISKEVIESKLGALDQNYIIFAKYKYKNETIGFWKPKK